MAHAGRTHRRRTSRGKQPHQNRLRLRLSRSILICAITCQDRLAGTTEAGEARPKHRIWVCSRLLIIYQNNQSICKQESMSERRSMMKLWLNEPPLCISDNRHSAQSPEFCRTKLLVCEESVRGRGWSAAKAVDEDSVCDQGAGGVASEPFA